MYKLRPYQIRAVDLILWDMNNQGNSIIAICQGGGKSHIIAEIAHKIQAPVLIICPNKEILEQNIEKMEQLMPRKNIGVFSASMNEKTVKDITYGTIQSMYKHPELFKGFKIVIYDECDLHNVKNPKGMSNTFFKAIGISKVFGFTGTPFRQAHYYERWGAQRWMLKTITTTKMINRVRPVFWNRMLVVVNTHELTEQGFLSPIEYHDVSLVKHEQIPTNKSKSDFDLEKFDKLISDRFGQIATSITNLPHKAKLVFCASITQAEKLQPLIKGSVVITSKTKKKVRAQAVSDLKNGVINTLLNVGIYTVGFDYPELDCLVLLRPTRSLRLHCQILGRVGRIAKGKTVGHVYDLVDNIKNMGRLDDIKIEKVENKWNVTSSAYPDGFHYVPLYSYKLQKPKKKKEEELRLL